MCSPVLEEYSKMRFIDVGDCGTDSGVARDASGSTRWFGTVLRPWTDRRFARGQCQRALRLYEQVHQERPDLRGRALYQEIVRRCAGGEPEQAIGIVRRAEDSFAAWPAGRDVRFRDVVAYVLIDELVLGSYGRPAPTDVERIVSAIIPAGI